MIEKNTSCYRYLDSPFKMQFRYRLRNRPKVSANLGFGIGPKPKQWFRSYTRWKSSKIKRKKNFTRDIFQIRCRSKMLQSWSRNGRTGRPSSQRSGNHHFAGNFKHNCYSYFLTIFFKLFLRFQTKSSKWMRNQF